MSNDYQLSTLIHYAINKSSFYKKKYQEAGIDIKSNYTKKDFAQLPIITPKELIEKGFEFQNVDNNSYRISSSSGTTQACKMLFRTIEDTEISSKVMCRLFEMANISKRDVLLIDQPFDLAHLGYISLEACKKMGVLAIPVGLSITDERLVQFLNTFTPLSIFTSPSRMVKITELLKNSSKVILKNILLAGEKASSRQITKIINHWKIHPHNLYGSEELDGLAGTCEKRKGLHFMNDYFLLELVKPNTNEIISKGNIGEAIITSLYARGTPLIRYRLGDIIQLHSQPCSCKRSWPLIEIKGRADQSINLYNGITLHLYQIESAIKQVCENSIDYQIICRELKRGVEELQVILDDSKAKSLVNRLEKLLWNCSLDLTAARSMKSLVFRVTTDADEMIITKRGKTPRIVDKRGGEL